MADQPIDGKLPRWSCPHVQSHPPPPHPSQILLTSTPTTSRFPFSHLLSPPRQPSVPRPFPRHVPNLADRALYYLQIRDLPLLSFVLWATSPYCFVPLPPEPAMAYYHTAPSWSPDFGQATKAGELYLKVSYTLVSTSTMFEGSHQDANPRGLGPPAPNVSHPRLLSVSLPPG